MTYYTLAQLRLETEGCYACGIVFAMPADFRRRALADHTRYFYCPAGHSQHYIGKSTEQKLREAEAREVALRDQLKATEREAENLRIKTLRERHRIANGVCPCCNRTFENVRRHIRGEHPEYDPGPISKDYRCSCAARFETLRGLRTHQGHMRPATWWDPSKPTWSRHLTTVPT